MSTKLERLLRMDGMIRSGNYPSVQTFMERFERSERTVREDLQFLRDRFGAPCTYDHTRRGYFYTDTTWKMPAFPVTEGQLLALFLSLELADRYLGTHFEQPLREAIEHIAETLPDHVQITIGELTQHYSIRPGAQAKTPPETLLSLQQAISEQHPVDMTYFTASRGTERQRIVHPYHLANMRGEWQLIAYDLFREDVRQFSLPRIRSLRTLNAEQFCVRDDFSLEDYFRRSFQTEHGNESAVVELWFDEYQARYIKERILHPSQEITEHPDGSLIVRFQTGALSEVQRQVLSYGRHVKVLAPLSLASAVDEEAQAITHIYAH